MILPLASGTFEPLAPSDRSADWAVTGRLGGVSTGPYASANIADHVGDERDSVVLNREKLADLVTLNQGDLAVMAPVHGSANAWVSVPGATDSVDALITEQPNIGLVAMGADCATIGIMATRMGRDFGDECAAVAVAAVHCGWQGLCSDVLGVTLGELRSWGATEFTVVIGPSICGSCYQVDSTRINRVRQDCATHIAQAALSLEGGIDIRAGLLADLTARGIDAQVIGGCTYESPDELFSFRRDHVTGRQGLIIALKESGHERI